MSKKKAKVMTYQTRAERELENMKYKDLQRACVARGMPFQEVVEGSVPRLSSWFCKHHDNSQNLALLDEFDGWKEDQLKRTGKYEKDSPIFSPDLRLGFIGHRDKEGNIETTKKPRLKGLDKKVKKKREKIEGTKVFKGTKKALTYELAIQNKLTTKEIIEKVIEQFPEAKDKSIAIWIKRAQKESGIKVKKK